MTSKTKRLFDRELSIFQAGLARLIGPCDARGAGKPCSRAVCGIMVRAAATRLPAAAADGLTDEWVGC